MMALQRVDCLGGAIGAPLSIGEGIIGLCTVRTKWGPTWRAQKAGQLTTAPIVCSARVHMATDN